MNKSDTYICFVEGNKYNKSLKEKSYSLNDKLFYGYFNLAEDKVYAEHAIRSAETIIKWMRRLFLFFLCLFGFVVVMSIMLLL